MNRIEEVLLRSLIFNDEFSRKTIPYFQPTYFSEASEKLLFGEINQFIVKYNNLPTTEALKIAVGSLNQSPESKDEIYVILDQFEKDKTQPIDQQWLIDQAEAFCKEKAIYNAVLESIQILDDKKGTKDRGAIPQLLSDALGVSFDTHVGHDYFEQSEERYEFYHKIENKIPFDLEYFNKITNGGITRKTLNVILAGCVHPETKVKIRYRQRNSN